MIELLYEYTEDGLRLQGVHYRAESDICVVFIHGTCGNIMENYFAHVWGELLQKEKVGFIYGHNRGYSHMNDILTSEGSRLRIGASYEIFEQCEYDVDLWVNTARKAGYKKIILAGHSFGANKCIYYLYKKSCKGIAGFIMASPPDMQGMKRGGQDKEAMLAEARDLINKGKPRELLSQLLGYWNYVSAETYENQFKEGSMCENLPVKANPPRFEQLETVNIPVLAFSGSKEEDLFLMLDLIKSKAVKCPDFKTAIIEGSHHTYQGFEEETGSLILNWIKENSPEEICKRKTF